MPTYIVEIINEALNLGASDIILTPDQRPAWRIRGILNTVSEFPALTGQNVIDILRSFKPEWEDTASLPDISSGEYDFAVDINSDMRARVHVAVARRQPNIFIRLIKKAIPTFEELGLPQKQMQSIATFNHGIVLVTGPTGSGKSTTIASLIDYMTRQRPLHVITIEDPIEYVFAHHKGRVTQRQIGSDTATKSFAESTRSALREVPDVIMVGEVRASYSGPSDINEDNPIAAMYHAAQSGHLLIASIHNANAAETITYIINQIHIIGAPAALSTTLRAVISQQLLPNSQFTGLTLAHEILMVGPSTRNIIRENKMSALTTDLESNRELGSMSMDFHLAQLAATNRITYDTALSAAHDAQHFNTHYESLR